MSAKSGPVEVDFTTDNMRYKAVERYAYGWTTLPNWFFERKLADTLEQVVAKERRLKALEEVLESRDGEA